MPLLKKILIITLSLVFGILFLIAGCDMWVEWSTRNNLYDSTDGIHHHDVGLILGTAKRLTNGQPNLYYQYRIDAAAELYHAGKISYILVSGDNGSIYYDEPTTIKKDLIAKGIPSERIYLDYAGFRTLDSVIRAKEIFGQTSLTIISQPFHNQRAIFIARRKGISAVGFNAKDVGAKYGAKIWVRERLARVKMMSDLIFGVGPRFLGEKIKIG